MVVGSVSTMADVQAKNVASQATSKSIGEEEFSQVLQQAELRTTMAPTVQIDEDYDEEQLHEDTEKVLQTSGNGKTTEVEKDTSEKTQSDDSGTLSLVEIFQKASQKYQVPYNLLVAVAKAESNFQPKATSKSGAQGIMQLMPATAKFLGVKDAYDPEQNIMGGAKYLSDKLKEQKGDVERALACYNAGSAAVKKYDGVPPYEETQNYVKIVQKYMNSDIEVPDKQYAVKDTTATQTDALAVKQTAMPQTLTAATLAASQVEATDMSEVTVVLGEGEEQVTLSYEAYQRYLELMSIGVG